jgi:excisionase family DNA binding protein
MTFNLEKRQTVVTGSNHSDVRLLLTVEEAARRLGIGRTSMYRLVSSGAVESVTVGRLRRVPSECLDNFVAALRSSNQRETTAA